MFENAELGHRVDKPTYERQAPVCAALLDGQQELAGANFSVIVIVAGVSGAGKGETVDLLLEWLDVRGIETHAMRELTDEERQRPAMWCFGWRCRPRVGSASSSGRGTPDRSSTAPSAGSRSPNWTRRSIGSSS